MKKNLNRKLFSKMSRRTQDIPIRPRYGLTDEEIEEERINREEAANARTRKTSTTSNSEVASSYKEIPFLAQYAGPVPDSVLSDLTPTATKPTPGRVESMEDEEEEEDNSKSSSFDNSNKTPKRPQSFLSDAIPYELEGSEDADGQMRHFVAENLEEKLRLQSPQEREGNFQIIWPL